MVKVLFCLTLFITPVFAQDMQPMPPIDRDLWNGMLRSFADISMPFQSHIAIQQIMREIENEAKLRKNKRDLPSK